MSNAVKVITLKNTSIRKYKGVTMLTCSITYPAFYRAEFQRNLAAINQRYQQNAALFAERCKGELYDAAVEDYIFDRQNDYPFPGYEANEIFSVSYNHSCTLSLYFDSYQYTGGAHGSTVRTSDTWNLETGEQYALKDFFPEDFDYKTYILTLIDAEIARQTADGSGVYFSDAPELARAAFNEESFYLTDQGIVIYFQQYDIAPYSSGIVEFLIPYESDVVLRPSCQTEKS